MVHDPGYGFGRRASPLVRGGYIYPLGWIRLMHYLAYRMASIPFSVIFQGPRAGMYEFTRAVGVCWVCSHAFP